MRAALGFGTSHDVGIAGVHVGFQHQMGSLVLGVEGGGKIRLSNDYGDTPGTGTAGTTCGTTATFACEARINNIVQIGPRLGWAHQNWMLYATGGYATAEIRTRARTIATGVFLSGTSVHQDGWFAGGGVEYLISRHVIVGVEYTHYDFNSETHNDFATPGNSRVVGATSDAVVGRLTFKFGRDEPRPLK